MTADQTANKIAALNDAFRVALVLPSFGPRPVPGQMVATRGIAALSGEQQLNIWFQAANFSGFTEDNDPHGERDFGAFIMEGVPEKIFWKIDYYADSNCQRGSEDPSDPAQSYRVLTIMLASEY